MTTQQFECAAAKYHAAAENAVNAVAEQYLPKDSSVCRAARYSLLGGGKRIRAMLVLAACELLNGDYDAAQMLAGAVEMLHCYSLIHDDLPCMDNDDYRRGRLSCHKAFDEATALLAGDVLLTEAFEAAANASEKTDITAKAAAALAAGAGSRGMVLGQELDLAAETDKPDAAQLEKIHHFKTGSLICASVQMGAACAVTSEEALAALSLYAFDLGLVFQIVDDILDVTSSPEVLGKPVGSDAANGKVTFATLYGVDGAMKKAQAINEKNCERMRAQFGAKAEFLIAFAQDLLLRKK